jgi:hypothetical protein
MTSKENKRKYADENEEEASEESTTTSKKRRAIGNDNDDDNSDHDSPPHRRRRSLPRRNLPGEPALTMTSTIAMTTTTMGATMTVMATMISSTTTYSISKLVVVLVLYNILCNISINSQSLNGSIYSIILCNISNGSICSKLYFLKKIYSDGP